MSSLRGKTVLLTGATRGIGRATALRAARDGARLALCGRDEALLAEVTEAARSAGADAVASCAFDLADDEALLAMLDAVRAEIGPIEILINNAGFNPRKAPLAEVTAEELDAVFAINLRAPFLLMRETHGEMKAAGGGHVVNILSTVCHADIETMGAYTAAKDAFQALTRIYRKEARPDGIRVTAIYPGGTDTDFRPNERPDYMDAASVAEAIYSTLTLPADLVVHEFTFRPMVESNF